MTLAKKIKHCRKRKDVFGEAQKTDEEREQYWKKEKETFLAVRDILKKSGNAWAYNMCYHTPWKIYGTHSVDECVKILLNKYTFPDRP